MAYHFGSQLQPKYDRRGEYRYLQSMRIQSLDFVAYDPKDSRLPQTLVGSLPLAAGLLIVALEGAHLCSPVSEPRPAPGSLAYLGKISRFDAKRSELQIDLKVWFLDEEGKARMLRNDNVSADLLKERLDGTGLEVLALGHALPQLASGSITQLFAGKELLSTERSLVAV